MDTIKVEIPFDKNDFLKSCWIKWKIQSGKYNRTMIISMFGAIIFYGLGEFLKTTDSSFSIFIALGLIQGFCAILMLLIIAIIFFVFKRKIKGMADRFEAMRMDCIYEFSDNSIKYADQERTVEYKWKVFGNYSIYKDYLVIIKSSPISSWVFNKESLGVDYEKIVELVKTKLQFKKIS